MLEVCGFFRLIVKIIVFLVFDLNCSVRLFLVFLCDVN